MGSLLATGVVAGARTSFALAAAMLALAIAVVWIALRPRPSSGA
jgi:hypothetical protein